MSDEHDWVRRLLADAGQSPEPMPPEVAARLDRVLDELAEESGPSAAAGPADTPAATAATTTAAPAPRHDEAVVPMTRRRHRRWAGAVLAAAAVTVGGYSLTGTGLLDDVTGGSESQSATDSAAGGALAPEPEPAPQAGAAEGGAHARDAAPQGPTELSSATLRRDARLLVSDPTPASASARGSAAQQDSREAPLLSRRSDACVPPPATVPGARVAVTYDGSPATAVVRRSSPGRSEVQVWDCASPVRLARVTVPR